MFTELLLFVFCIKQIFLGVPPDLEKPMAKVITPADPLFMQNKLFGLRINCAAKRQYIIRSKWDLHCANCN